MKAFAVCLSIVFMPAGLVAEVLIPERPGSYERSFEADDFRLRFGLEVPEGATSGPRPLVLALHYGFDSSRPFPRYYGKQFAERVISPGLRDLSAFIVSPDSHGHHWVDDEIAGPVLSLLDALATDPRVDGERIVVAGYSLGGTGTWFFAGEHTERFAAAVPMAGRMRPEWVERTNGLPVHALYSGDDELVSSKQIRDVLRRLRVPTVEFTELQGVSHYQSPLYAQALRAIIVPWLRVQLAGSPEPADSQD